MDGSARAVVVGAGPNGLAAAITLAQAGLAVTVLEAADEVGGGARTAQVTGDGLAHDICSAIHPFGAASPFFSSLPLADHGLQWRWPEIDLAHPLDGGRAGVLLRSIDQTAAALGDDAGRWRRLFEPLAARFHELAEDALAPVQHLPRHPIDTARFGLRALMPATALASRFDGEEGRALLAGAAAHAMRPLDGVASAAVGAMLLAAGHSVGWPVAAGGSGWITKALASLLTTLGGTIETGVEVKSLAELAPATVIMLDLAPEAVVRLAGDRLPRRVRRAYERWRHAPAAFKVDLAVEGGVPWTAEACRRAGTVHLGGTFEEVAAAEADIGRGRLPERPFVLVAQQYLCDPDRSVGDVHPVWSYAQVPYGYGGDATEAVIHQIERFAPGTRERIVARHTMSPAEFEDYNANDIGGDISLGSNDPYRLLFRPRLAAVPYATGLHGVYLCSAATPPGPGVHGMCGRHAATAALRALHRRQSVL